MKNQPPLPNWEEDDFSDSIVEAQLKASIANAQRESLPRVQPAAQPIHRPTVVMSRHEQSTPADAVGESTHTQLIAGCGIAAVDGYLQIRDYAASKGLDVAELHHKGIDLQDLISTLVIHTQRMAEMEVRPRRWKS